MRRARWFVGGLVVLLVALSGLRQLARARTVQAFGQLVARVDTNERRVALTFDDGPAPAVLDSIERVLASRGVQATFFVTGAELANAPRAGERLVRAGHELGNHTYSHERMVLRSPSFLRSQIERTDSLIRAAGQQGAVYFRPPYGYKLFALPWYLGRTARTTVMWDVEPDSYPDVAATPAGIVRYVLERVRPGSIILLHPWYPSRATSLAAVGPLIDSLHARGYEVGPVRALVAPPASQGDSSTASARTAIGRAWADHIAAAKRHDLAGVIAMYAKDAVYAVGGAPEVRGRPAIDSMEAQGLRAVTVIDARHQTHMIRRVGDIAYEVGTIVGPVKPAGDTARVVTFNFMAQWRREPSGAWHLAYLVGR